MPRPHYKSPPRSHGARDIFRLPPSMRREKVSKKAAADAGTFMGITLAPAGAPAGKEKKAKVKQLSAASSSGEIADFLQLGKSRRKVNSRAWSGDWTSDQIGQLFRSNRLFADQFMVLIASDAGVPPAPEDKSFQGYLHRVLRAAFGDRASRFRDRARIDARHMANFANAAKKHPATLSNLLFTAVLNNAQATGSRADWMRGAENAFRAVGSTVRGGEYGDMLSIVRTLKRLDLRAMAGNKIIDTAASVVRGLGSFSGFYAGKNLHGWSKGGGGKALGIELIGIEYIVPTRFDENGKPDLSSGLQRVEHELAAARIDANFRDPAARKAVLGLTPAGRFYLCTSTTGKGTFLACDRAPSRRLFLANEQSVRDAIVNGKADGAAMSGLII